MGNAQLGKRGLHPGQRAEDHAGVEITQVANAKRAPGQWAQATGTEDLTELIGVFKKRPGGNILQPTVDGQPGNPVLIDDKARALVLASEAHLGCRHLMDRQPELVYAYAGANRRLVTDLDTEQDLRAMAERTSWQLELPEAAVA